MTSETLMADLRLTQFAANKVVAARGSRRAVSHSPVFQALFHVSTVDESFAQQGSEVAVEEPTIKLDLEMQLMHQTIAFEQPRERIARSFSMR